MAEFSRLYKEVSDLTNVISLITQRSPYLEEDGYALGIPDGPDSLSFEEPESSDDEGDELVKETEFEDETAAGDPKATFDALKRIALDRLAEVLARFKTTRTQKIQKGLDARHVASVALMEDYNNRRVVIFCSKNDGIDAADETFLGKLVKILKLISEKGEMQEESIQSVFDIMFEHQTPRVEFYSEILRGAFKGIAPVISQNTLTREIIEQQSQLPFQPREWEDNYGLRFKFLPSGNGEGLLSDEAINSLSNQEETAAVTEIFQEIKSIFGNIEPVSLSLNRTSKLLRSIYIILRHPRRRPALKNLLRQALHGNDKVFGKVWDALLFMARIFHGAVTLVDLASKLKNQHSIEFVAVPAIRNVKEAIMSEDPEKIHDVLFELLADDDLCRMFGFNNCFSLKEVTQLACLYDTVISRCHCPVKVMHTYLKAGELANFLLLFCQQWINQMSAQSDFDSMHWFLNRQTIYPFSIPDLDKAAYEIWLTALDEALTALYEVFKLFVTIQPSVGRLPDIHSSAWLNFGFCYCKSFQHRNELADMYLKLASSNATFDDIVSAYETSTMADLMTAHGIDFLSLTHHGIRLEKPPPCQNAVFRLMTGVEHALSGRYCECFRMREDRQYYGYFETHFDLECDVCYGFHLSTSWERWQLLNFYKYIFRLPGFDPQRMAEAKNDHQHGSLERYLDTLVPNMRKRTFDINLAGSILFPALEGRITATTKDGERTSYLPCVFPAHDVEGPRSIQWDRRSNV
ncbi:hypothetical protein N7523_001831 [Penicillium sp. IBT 18751x]|nr:hypothetical protein N7523_001831 [Penicillium sp. IBT 18751x]